MYTHTNEIPTIVSDLRFSFNQGNTKSIDFRRQQLQGLCRFLKEREAEIIQAVHKDINKHELETLVSDIAPVLGEIEYMLNNLNNLVKETKVKAQYKMNMMDKLVLRKEPKGVVLIIGSWNYPIHLLLLPVVGAIAAGNCIVIKPSEISASTSELIGRVLPEYLDTRCYRIVQGGVEETTALLREQFDHIFYTGNGRVGKIVMRAASEHLTPVTLELGGKSPAIVAPDVNLETAANRILWGKFFNDGQTCVAPDYALVYRPQFNDFVEFCRKIIKKRYSDNPQAAKQHFRIINKRRFDALKSLLEEVDPAKILIGGKTDMDDNFYVAPTVVGPLEPNETRLMEEEVFGPILPIVPYDSIEELINIIKSKPTPLALYLFSDDKATVSKVLDNTQSGGVCVNDVLMNCQELGLSFGGVGPSGMGAYHGKTSFDTFTHERATMIKSSGLESIMMARYPPYNNDKQLLYTLLTIGLPSTFIAKIKTICQSIGAARRVFSSPPANKIGSKL